MIDVIKEMNEYVTKINEKQLSKKFIWHSWVKIIRKKFRAFTDVILNVGIIPLASIVEYSRLDTTAEFHSIHTSLQETDSIIFL